MAAMQAIPADQYKPRGSTERRLAAILVHHAS
jgi:hypothetical protein